MSGNVRFRNCPNCQHKGNWLSRVSIYKCPICFKLFCFRCVARGWFSAYCPGCGAKLDSHVGPEGWA